MNRREHRVMMRTNPAKALLGATVAGLPVMAVALSVSMTKPHVHFLLPRGTGGPGDANKRNLLSLREKGCLLAEATIDWSHASGYGWTMHDPSGQLPHYYKVGEHTRLLVERLNKMVLERYWK